jgi:2-polyprenyl-3-methyl-5-hydroxy-6-metoxy-1,4-benzoquinol methylase
VTVSPYLNDPYLSFETTDTLNYVNNIDLYTNAISNDALRYLVGKMEANWSAFGKQGRGNLLEVGCAAGYFLFTAQARDWTVQGVELGRSIGEWGKKYLHLPIFIGSFEDADFEDESFDVVVAIEVLEHVLDPRLLLNSLYSKLKPGGMLFLTTPNVYSTAYYPPQSQTPVLEPTDHLNLFSKENLLMLLKSLSFSKINLEFDGPEDIQLQVFAQKATEKTKN